MTFSLVAITMGCHKVNTDPEAVASVELLPFASPSVVIGDSLRDTLGTLAPLVAYAYNVQGDIVTDAPIRFRIIDPTTDISVDSLTGIVTGHSITSTPIRIIADSRGLQTQPRHITVTYPPDSVAAINEVDTVLYGFTDIFSQPLQLALWHGTGSDSIAVSSYLVSFSLSAEPDTLAFLVGENGTVSVIDTTGNDGIASRRVRIRPIALQSASDSVVVLASVKYRGAPVPGSPVRFVVHIRAQLQP